MPSIRAPRSLQLRSIHVVNWYFTMNSLTHLQYTLAVRRRRGQHLTSYNDAEQSLDPSEVRNTNLEATLFVGSQVCADINEHRKDIDYTKKWYNIYQAIRERQLVPARNMLIRLVRVGENRIEELEEKLESVKKFEYYDDELARDKYQPMIDMIRWKLKYYQQTVKDGKEMLEMHDDQTMYLDLPMGPDSWWTFM